jgi:two-component system cell cycle response regulator
VLRRTAEVMNEVVREMDLLCRYGGEEFVLLASGTDLAGAVNLGEKIRAAIAAARFEVEEVTGLREAHLTVSIGVAPFKGDPHGFFNDADTALYRAKREGKNCVVASE